MSNINVSFWNNKNNHDIAYDKKYIIKIINYDSMIMNYIIELYVSDSNISFSLYTHTQRKRKKERVFFKSHTRIRLIKYF